MRSKFVLQNNLIIYSWKLLTVLPNIIEISSPAAECALRATLLLNWMDYIEVLHDT